MERSLAPELLDSLPPTHPAAMQNRRDLRLTNRVMRNHRWLTQTLSRLVRPGEPALEVGAGIGELARRLHQHGIAADGLDQWPPPHGWPPGRRWHQLDLRRFEAWQDYPVIYGNLIFHQFTNGELGELGRRMRSARVLVACEPARRRWSQIAYRLLAPLCGANYVSLHDAHVSIAAGFLGDELPQALGLAREAWDVRCATAFPGAYHLVAIRRS